MAKRKRIRWNKIIADIPSLSGTKYEDRYYWNDKLVKVVVHKRLHRKLPFI